MRFCKPFFDLLVLTDSYLKLLYNQQAVILVSVYMYLPMQSFRFLQLLINSFSLLKLPNDLGAGIHRYVRVLLPNIKRNYSSFDFHLFHFGAYTVPRLVGGKDSYMIEI